MDLHSRNDGSIEAQDVFKHGALQKKEVCGERKMGHHKGSTLAQGALGRTHKTVKNTYIGLWGRDNDLFDFTTLAIFLNKALSTYLNTFLHLSIGL